jgi:outer membrane protein OmpA-like peptidoglycan-associated protein
MQSRMLVIAVAATIVGTMAARAQTTQPTATPPTATHPSDIQPTATHSDAAQPEAAKGPDSLSIYFSPSSAAITAQGDSVLDQAARTYRDGKPIIMVVSGGSDTTGSAASNLSLSQRRADNVLQGLVARGIPIERFQVLAKGETEPAVPDPRGKAEPRNRRVEISWR